MRSRLLRYQLPDKKFCVPFVDQHVLSPKDGISFAAADEFLSFFHFMPSYGITELMHYL